VSSIVPKWDWVDQALVDSRDPSRTMCYGGDFDIYEDTGDAGDAQFCINGLIFADRSPHPAVQELWYLQSPIKVSYNNAGAILTISNRYRFLSLDHLQFKWSITSAPINNNHNNHNNHNNANNSSPLVLREGVLDLSRMTHHEDENPVFMPGGHYHGPMPFTSDELQLLKDKHGRDHTHANDPHLYLNIRVELTQAEQQRGWNHSPQQERLVVSECFALFDRSSLHNPMNAPATTTSSAKGNKAHVFEVNKQQLVVKGKKYEIIFAKETGKFVQMTDRGSNTPLILGCDHAFYRAATDNDKGGLSESAVGANTMKLISLMDRVCGTSLTTEGPSATSFHGQWEKYGLHNVEAIAVEPVTVIKGHVLVQNDQIVSVLSKEPLFFVQTTWTFYQEEYTMDVEVTVGKGLPASLLSLPRIGMHFELPASYTTMQYEGRGPNECYADRKASNPPGLWEMTVDEGHVPYVVPSENGGRCDVTSLTMRSNDKNKNTFKVTYEQVDEEPPPKEQPLTGVFIHKGGHAGEVRKRPAGVKGAQINLSRYSVEELNRARHDDELVGRREGQEGDVAHKTVHLHVDTAHMGVGGDTGWTPETHLQYRISGASGNVWKYRLTVEVV
jgi:beta-galactosidase